MKENGKNAQDFYLDMNELKSQITEKTKMMIVNTPNNPTGKVFTLDELKVTFPMEI